jgi:hypothetical protein
METYQRFPLNLLGVALTDALDYDMPDLYRQRPMFKKTWYTNHKTVGKSKTYEPNGRAERVRRRQQVQKLAAKGIV